MTDDAVLRDPRFAAAVERLLEIGGNRVALHLRGHRTSGRQLWAHAERCSRFAAQTGATLLVNDRLDVALGCGASGVQLGRASLPIGSARLLIGEHLRIGASVHSVEEAETAVLEGADFLLAGTLYETDSHPCRPATGVGWLTPVCRLGVPVIGIGGVVPSRVAEILARGAHGVAAIRGIWAASHPAQALSEFLAEVE